MNDTKQKLAEVEREEPVADKGPWSVSEDGKFIQSDDFTHDVRLYVTGDFSGAEQHKKYSQHVSAILNAAASSGNVNVKKEKSNEQT